MIADCHGSHASLVEEFDRGRSLKVIRDQCALHGITRIQPEHSTRVLLPHDVDVTSEPFRATHDIPMGPGMHPTDQGSVKVVGAYDANRAGFGFVCESSKWERKKQKENDNIEPAITGLGLHE